MAWEERNGNYYYYRKQRVGQNVVSQYLGSGYLAEMVAEEDELEREHERQKRREEKELIEADLDIDKELDQVCKFVSRLVYAVLLENGYHTHKGQWRKLRND